MSAASPFNRHAWIIVLLLAAGFLVWCAALRIQRVNTISALGPQERFVDATSPSGYAGGRHWLIVPEHNIHCHQWIDDTQQMFADRVWRIRWVDRDNAPVGRPTYSPSPYRWWLGAIAWCDHLLFNRPIGLSVERAAMLANPLLHLLLLLVSTVAAARWFGAGAAALMAVGLVTLFPLAGAFLPGVPDSQGLTLVLALWSVLPLLRLCGDSPQSNRQNDRRFLVAGISGGLGLWIDVEQQSWVLLGIAFGEIAAALIWRNTKHERQWRIWALSGAVTSLAAYLVEYFPAHLDWRPQLNHPIYGLAWLGLAELTAQVTSWGTANASFYNRKRATLLVLACTALAALPVAFWSTGQYPASDPLSAQLTSLPDGTAAATFGAWITHDGLSSSVLITCLPLAALFPILFLGGRRSLAVGEKAPLILGLGATLIALGFAWFHLRAWSLVEVTLLAVATAAAGVGSRSGVSPAFRRFSFGGAVLIALGGLIRIWPPVSEQAKGALTRRDSMSLIERDVAHWIADRTSEGVAVILAPPFSNAGLVYYGGLRGLGSPAWENQEGLTAAVQILSSMRGEIALERFAQRGVTHIVLPSWDNDLDVFMQRYMAQPKDSLLAAIHRSALPTWMRPLAYTPPIIPGFKGQSVAVFKVTDESEKWVGLARRAEYFLEMKQLDSAESAGVALKAYPGNPGALASRAEVEKARGNDAEFNALLDALRTQLRGNPARALPWDRRVSVAIVLALGGEADLAREQAQRCLDQINEDRIRDMNTGALYRFLVLTKAYSLQFPTPKLRDEALRLLPVELRARF